MFKRRERARIAKINKANKSNKKKEVIVVQIRMRLIKKKREVMSKKIMRK